MSQTNTRKELFDFLREVEKKLEGNIQLVAVGGTAMTLLNLKPSTIDMDFTGPGKDIEEFNRAQKSLDHGYLIDTWTDGNVFAIMLPDDYISRSSPIDANLARIKLYALSLVDVVITKAARLNQRDWQDIESCIAKGHLKEGEILTRSKQVSYVGNEEVYANNISLIVEKLTGKNKSSIA